MKKAAFTSTENRPLEDVTTISDMVRVTAEQFDGIAELTVDYERAEVRVATVDGRIVVQAGVAQREKGLLDFNG